MSIANYKEIYLDNEEFRIDSEYYKKEYINIYNKINNGEKLGNLVHMSDVSTNGSFAVVHAILNDSNPPKVPYIRSSNVGNTFLYKEDLTLISEEAHEKLPKSTTKLHDVMMARKGKIGGASIITENEVNYNCNENVIKLTILASRFNPFYFTTYFNSKYGIKQIERISTGNVQPWVSIFQIKKLLIPYFSLNFQKDIEIIIIQSHHLLNQSKDLYSQAEQLLLEELGLKDWIPSDEQTNIKSFKDSFMSTGRLDAEYYQPKYEDYLDLILNYKNGCKVLDQACQIKDFNYTPIEEQEYKYIELSNIGNAGDINGCSIDLGVNLPSRARRQVKKGDVLISSIEGSLSSCALITNEYDSAICSTGFYVVNSELINSETLLVLFKSELLQNLLKQGCSGTILTAINKTEFTNLPIPVIDKPIQQQIADNIQESFRLKRQSEQLLQVAKRAVEIAIEQNEDVAIAYINQNSIE